MSSVTRCWDLISALSIAWLPVLGTIVWVLITDPWSGNVDEVVGASCWSTWVGTTRLLALSAAKEARINTRHLGDERECHGGLSRESNCNQRVLHVEEYLIS
jgi:hypothetical protein